MCQYCVRATPRVLWYLLRPSRAQTTCCLPIPPSSAWTTQAAMGNNTDVVHYIKCADPKTPVRKRCHRCYKKYRNNNSALNRQKKNDLIKKKKQEVWQIKRDPFIQICFVIYIRTLTYLFSHLFTYFWSDATSIWPMRSSCQYHLSQISLNIHFKGIHAFEKLFSVKL